MGERLHAWRVYKRALSTQPRGGAAAERQGSGVELTQLHNLYMRGDESRSMKLSCSQQTASGKSRCVRAM